MLSSLFGESCHDVSSPVTTPKNSCTDTLNLESCKHIAAMLKREGVNTPNEEQLILSMRVTKINARGTEQKRIFVLTDKAVYNLKPNNLNYSRRRIDLTKIGGIACADATTDFVIHVPSEYDYHFKSEKRRILVQTVADVYESLTKHALVVTHCSDDQLVSSVVKRKDSNSASVEQKLGKWQDHFDEGKSKLSPYDFHILEIIGEGGFAKVTRVVKKDNDQIYAMKELNKLDLIQRDQVRNTKAERKILLKTRHPFLMHLEYAFQTETKLYMILPFCKGGDLFFHLEKMKRFTEEQARFITAELALAIAHLHSLFIVYRDLKPENVLLDKDGHVCLTDFGLAKDLADHNQCRTHTWCGTPSYMAPEVHGEDYSLGVDWWGLGCVLYELVYGWKPFQSKQMRLLPLRFPKNPPISAQCKDCISKLLERDESKRLCCQNGVEELQKHPFFEAIHWDKLLKKELEPPYCPEVTHDLDCISDEFQSQTLREKTHAAPPETHRGVFRGFTCKRLTTDELARARSDASTDTSQNQNEIVD